MAVRAYELALRDFVQYTLATATPRKVPQGRCLDLTVIPLHCRVVELQAAVRAGLPNLEADVPGHELCLPTLVLPLPMRLVCLVVGCSILAPARLAPWLMSVAPAMKLSQRLVPAATPTVLCPCRWNPVHSFPLLGHPNVCSHGRRTERLGTTPHWLPTFIDLKSWYAAGRFRAVQGVRGSCVRGRRTGIGRGSPWAGLSPCRGPRRA